MNNQKYNIFVKEHSINDYAFASIDDLILQLNKIKDQYDSGYNFNVWLDQNYIHCDVSREETDEEYNNRIATEQQRLEAERQRRIVERGNAKRIRRTLDEATKLEQQAKALRDSVK